MTKKLSKKIIFSCFLASCLEIYDFAIFAYFVPVMHKNYLSFVSAEIATIITYLFFAIGFVFRPLGSVIFGYIGDVFGRKTSLMTSVSLMGIASFTMFVLPTYEMIGIYSCAIIVLVRIIQGISVGGEFSGAIIFAVEHSSQNRAGLVAATVSAGGATGVLLSSLVSSILQHPLLPEYSWRFAFLIGFGLAIIGYFIRNHLTDTPIFKRPTIRTMPIIEGFKTHKTEIVASIFLSAANGVTFYCGAIYLSKMLDVNKFGSIVNFIPIIVGVTMVLFLPFFGMLSDKVERKNMLFISTVIMSVYSIFMMNIINVVENVSSLVALVVVYMIGVASMTAGVNTYVVEIFPPQYRMSCSGVAYSIGMGFIGGTVPFVASYLAHYFVNYQSLLGNYIAFICALGFLGVFMVFRKNKVKMYSLIKNNNSSFN